MVLRKKVNVYSERVYKNTCLCMLKSAPVLSSFIRTRVSTKSVFVSDNMILISILLFINDGIG